MVVVLIAVVAVILLIAVIVLVRRREPDTLDSFRRQIDALSPEARRPVVDQVQQIDDESTPGSDDEHADDDAGDDAGDDDTGPAGPSGGRDGT